MALNLQNTINSSMIPNGGTAKWGMIASAAATFSTFGTSTTINSGTLANNNQTDSTYTSVTSGAVAGNAAGVETTSVQVVQRQHSPTFYCLLRTGADITNVRYWIGWFNPDPGNTDIGSSNHVGFRFSTVAGDTGWRPSVDVAGVQTLGANIGTVAASTRYMLKCRIDTTNNKAYFSVDGSAETVITGLPNAAQNWAAFVKLYTTNASAKTFSLSRFYFDFK